VHTSEVAAVGRGTEALVDDNINGTEKKSRSVVHTDVTLMQMKNLADRLHDGEKLFEDLT
jgi:hypothetical protein